MICYVLGHSVNKLKLKLIDLYVMSYWIECSIIKVYLRYNNKLCGQYYFLTHFKVICFTCSWCTECQSLPEAGYKSHLRRSQRTNGRRWIYKGHTYTPNTRHCVNAPRRCDVSHWMWRQGRGRRWPAGSTRVLGYAWRHKVVLRASSRPNSCHVRHRSTTHWHCHQVHVFLSQSPSYRQRCQRDVCRSHALLPT